MKRAGLAAGLLALAASAASGQAPPAGGYEANAPDYPRFRPGERQIIEDYLVSFPGQVPPGALRQPGVGAGLARQQRLPPGIARRTLPSGLAARLPALPQGYARLLVDNDAAIVATANGVVFDILPDVF